MRSPGVAVVAVAGLLVCVVGACGDDAGAVEAAPDGGGVEASAEAEAGAACAVVFVSGDVGDDANDGCTTTAPKKTIGGALAVAGAEVRVCRGTYREANLRIARATSLRGGYDCATWRRGEGFGRKGAFADPNVTQIETPDAASPFASLTVAGAGIGREVIVDGLRVVGRDGAEGSTALAVIDGAKPMLADLQIVGGAAKVGTLVVGSVGLAVLGGAAPEVMDSDIRGGAGHGKIGSIGLRVNDASVDAHDCTIDGGSGTGLVMGALAVMFDGAKAGTGTFARDVVSWGKPTSEGSFQIGGAGVYAVNGTVDVTTSTIRGGTAFCHSAPCLVHGVATAAGVKLRVTRTLVSAGDVVGVSGSGARGISLLGAVDAVVASNVIHAKTSFSAVGVEADAPDATIVGNTIVAVSGNASAYGVLVGGTKGGEKGTGAVIDGNVFGTVTTTSAGLRVLGCDGAKLRSAKRNAFVATPFALEHVQGAGCADATRFASPRDMETFLGDAAARENVQVAPGCASPSCVAGFACADNDACMVKLFPAYDAASSGLANLFSTKGYAFGANVPCALARGGVSPAGETLDVYGAARTAPFSIGASEQDACVD